MKGVFDLCDERHGTSSIEQRGAGKLGNESEAVQSMLIETFEEPYDPSLYALKYQLLDYMVEGIRRFETMSVAVNSPYENSSVHIKQACSESSRKRRAGMLEAVNVMRRNYGEALQHD